MACPHSAAMFRGRLGGYLCSAQCSVAAVGTWSVAASQWGSCPLIVGAGIVGGSQLPEEQAGSTGVAKSHAHSPSLLRPTVQFQPSFLTPRTPHCVLITWGFMSNLTCTKAQNRGSLRCLALSCSRANDWRLQKREEIFWNHEPSAPSNCRKI